MAKISQTNQMDRRSFLRSAAAAGAGLWVTPSVLAQTAVAAKGDDINIALLGVGAQGQTLMDAMTNIEGIRIKAVCDIWSSWNLLNVWRRLIKIYDSKVLKEFKKLKQDEVVSKMLDGKYAVNAYIDYKEMLDKETDLDAVIIATPDFWHAEHTIACLEKGLHVYCEKEMSNTLEGAKKMVEAAKKTGKLLQIGHQRRSNPRYIHCYEKLIKEASLLGRITTINGQWNRAASPPNGYAKKVAIDEATLGKYGFTSMEQFRNWRWYKGLGGGPIVDLGSHQIDIYSWFLDANPRAVVANGGTDYYSKESYQWYDTVMAIYEYQTPVGVVRAFYQTITTNSCQGYYETFMGDQGTLQISEASSRGACYRENSAPAWDEWVKKGYLSTPQKKEAAITSAQADLRESPQPDKYDIPVEMKQKYHQPHLQNFFDSIRGKATLNCPAEDAYKTAVAVLKVNDAIEAARRLEFKPEEFQI